MKKRGATHVDWAISLALFLLYVAWFFIFINPTFMQDNTQEALISIVESNFKDEYRWEIRTLPIVIYTNQTNSYLPIVEDFNYNWTNIYLKDKEYLLDNGKIIFLADVDNETKTYLILNSNENYTYSKEYLNFNANNSVATSGNLKVELENSLFKTIEYKNKLRLNKTRIYIENDLIETNNNISNITNIAAFYRIKTESLNHTTYVFAENSFLWNIIKLSKNGSYIFELKTELYDYENYFATNNYHGKINYTYPGCKEFNNDYITFYNGNGISFIFNKTAAIRFCYDNDIINLNISFSLENETYYKIHLHEGDYSNITKKQYEVKFGAIEREKGLYLEKLNNMNYNSLKTEWNYPNEREFRLIIWNTTSADLVNRTNEIIDIGVSQNTEDVSVKEWDDFIITKHNIKYPALVNIKTW